MITPAQLVEIYGCSYERANRYAGPLSAAMDRFGITSIASVCAFIAQVGHESGRLRYNKELASGAAYDTGRLAERLGNTPEADGDGQRYKGRGPIQITGTDNYIACGAALGLDLIANPELLETAEYGCAAAAWFFSDRGCIEAADAGDFRKVTKIINGGYNGMEDREELFANAQEVLGG